MCGKLPLSLVLLSLTVVAVAPMASSSAPPALLVLSKPGLSSQEAALANMYNLANAWQQATYLSTPNDGWADRIGLIGKVSGTPEEKAVASYLAQQLQGYGLDSVSVENYITTSWDFRGTEVRVVSPEPGTLYPSSGEGLCFASQGTIDAHGYDSMVASGMILPGHFTQIADGNWSYNFANQGDSIVAPLVWVGRGTAKEFDATGSVTGKVALILRDDGVTQWPTAPLFEAANRGAIASLIYGYFGESQVPDSVRGDIVCPGPIPAFETTINVAHHLQSLLAQGPVRVSLKGTSNIISDTEARSVDVVGVLKGWRYPDEMVIVGAQVDTWFYGPSNSNSGVATTLELARIFGQMAAQGQRPARTIVFALVGSEELGGPISTWFDWIGGSYAFVKRRPDIGKVMVADIDLSNIGFKSRDGTHGMDGSWETQGIVKRTLRDMGLDSNVSVSSGLNPFSDLWSYSAVAGGSTIQCCHQPGYGKYYHTWNDTMADQSPWQYAAFGRYFTVLTYRLANSLVVPLDMASTLEWVAEGINRVEILAPEPSLQSSYGAAQAALTQLQQDWQTILSRAILLKGAYLAQGADRWAIESRAEALNHQIMEARVNIVRWMVTTGGSMGGWWFYHRGEQYASDIYAISVAQTALASGNLQAAADSLKGVAAMDWGHRMSPLTYRQIIEDIEANLWWAGEWDQQPKYTDVRMDYERLQHGMPSGVDQDLTARHSALVVSLGASMADLTLYLGVAHASLAGP